MSAEVYDTVSDKLIAHLRPGDQRIGKEASDDQLFREVTVTAGEEEHGFSVVYTDVSLLAPNKEPFAVDVGQDPYRMIDAQSLSFVRIVPS